MLRRSDRRPAVLEPEQQYAVVLLNEDQLGQFMRRPGLQHVNRGYPVADVHTRYLRLKRQTATAAILLLVLAAGGFFYFMAPQPALASMNPWNEARQAPTIDTGASFSVTIASLDSGDGANAAAGRVRALGFPAFTRVSPDRRRFHQAMVGPYASLDEAERVQRRLARSGFAGGRLFVDESLRNAPRNALVADISDGDPNIVLIAAPERVSLVFEMALEPRQVRSRRAETMLDLDVGPIANPIHTQQWSAPEGVHLVERVGIEGIQAPESGQFMRAHVAIPEFAHANVRTEGRRVYVDLTWPLAVAEAPARQAQADARPPVEARPAVETPVAKAAIAVEAKPKPVAVAAPEEEPSTEKYAAALAPVQERLGAVKPFLMSATQSGSPDVLGALDETLATLEASLKAMHPPGASVDQHQMLIASVRTARRAVAPTFAGDRTAQAREAFVLYDAATSGTLIPAGR